MKDINTVKEINLAGTWDFTPEDGEKQAIEVPAGGWLKQGFTCDFGTYERYITIPKVENPGVTRLELEAVNHLAEYYLGEDENNLRKIHSEVTAFTPQSVDLTPHVQPGKTYLLRIFVRSHQDGKAIAPHNFEGWPIPRGIFRGAYLKMYPDLFIEDAFIKTYTIDNTLKYEVRLTNASSRERIVTLKGGFGSWNGNKWQYPIIPVKTITIKSNETKKVTIGPMDWRLGPESYWWPNIPYQEGYKAKLHILTLTLLEGQDDIHTADFRFGFREIKQAGPYFTLNGTRINFRGDSLQVGNYDKIDYNGKGDAIDTLPGFLPPSENNPGWPKAVDNFLRLNFNLQRAHRQPWAPYMLDICDEMGLMIMGEGSCGWYEYDRAYHEMKCLQDMVERDKNHPSIVRWSLKNEPICPDESYHNELYEAVKSVDNTRPICIHIGRWNWDIYDPDKMFKTLKQKDDFTWMEQFLSFDEKGNPYYSTKEHNNAVIRMGDRPYGLGGGIWPHCSTKAGLVLFATMIALVRAEEASDIRPYVLLSSWASSIPGVKTSDFLTEEGRYPVYGEDNLSDPWSHPGIKLIQKACNPLFAFDYKFWKMNESSNSAGCFPVVVPKIKADSKITREIVVFNDDLFDSEIDLSWEVREENPSNKIFDQGETKIHIKPGFMIRTSISFKTTRYNCSMFLTLHIRKNGVERFSDNLTCFEVVDGEDYKYWGYGDNKEIPEEWLKRQL